MPSVLTNSGFQFLYLPCFLLFLLLFIFLNVDNDGVPDYLDLDSDGDGLLDVLEYGSRYVESKDAAKYIGQVYMGGSPDDSDCCSVLGFTDSKRLAEKGTPCYGRSQRSNAMCGHYDFRDADADGDGISDTEECGADVIGTSFNGHNFNTNNEILIVVVDGGVPQPVNINVNCDTAVNCATALTPLISGASVSTVDGNLVITSATSSSSGNVMLLFESSSGSAGYIKFQHYTTGGNAKALFGDNPLYSNANCRDTDGK